ncbi:YnfU family zinc-binding protein [Pantoea sp.]|uniref:YnfU family zinc-binding protein n=1 Tax=Pantoea sp. TaxID=69393 RepID=UPI00391803BA
MYSSENIIYVFYTKGLRYFKERPVDVACPVCEYRADQKAGKLRQDAVLESPACRLLFRPSECWCIGG